MGNETPICLFAIFLFTMLVKDIPGTGAASTTDSGTRTIEINRFGMFLSWPVIVGVGVVGIGTLLLFYNQNKGHHVKKNHMDAETETREKLVPQHEMEALNRRYQEALFNESRASEQEALSRSALRTLANERDYLQLAVDSMNQDSRRAQELLRRANQTIEDQRWIMQWAKDNGAPSLGAMPGYPGALRAQSSNEDALNDEKKNFATMMSFCLDLSLLQTLNRNQELDTGGAKQVLAERIVLRAGMLGCAADLPAGFALTGSSVRPTQQQLRGINSIFSLKGKEPPLAAVTDSRVAREWIRDHGDPGMTYHTGATTMRT